MLARAEGETWQETPRKAYPHSTLYLKQQSMDIKLPLDINFAKPRRLATSEFWWIKYYARSYFLHDKIANESR